MEYYQQYSLKEGFSSLDTTLQVPYREQPNGKTPKAITKAGSGEHTLHEHPGSPTDSSDATLISF